MYKYEAFTSLAQSVFILPEIRKTKLNVIPN